MRYLCLSLFFLLLSPVSAHQFLPTKATLNLLSTEDYLLSSELDVIELMQTTLDLKGDSSSLIEQVRSLSQNEIEDGLVAARARVLESTRLSFGEYQQPPG